MTTQDQLEVDVNDWSDKLRRVLRRAAIGAVVLVALELGWHK